MIFLKLWEMAAALKALYVVKVSMAKTMPFEVFSISRPCNVGKIDKNKRT
jgi:hypothetical protein